LVKKYTKKNIFSLDAAFEDTVLKLHKYTYKVWFYSNNLLYRQNFWILVVIFIALGYIGQLEVNNVTIELGQNFTILYFLIIFMLSMIERIFFYLFFIIVFFMYMQGVFFNGFFGNIIIEHITKNATI
jgi:hypothetical protein